MRYAKPQMRRQQIAGIAGGLPVQARTKIIDIADKFNVPGLKKQQGTTRTIYDSIPIDGRSEYRFFEEANTRQFPLTNQSSDGNKLGVGSAMAIERVYLSIVEFDGTQVLNIFDLGQFGAVANGVTLGELSFETANTQKIKQVSMLSADPRFNKDAEFDRHNNFTFDNDIILMPLLEFVFKLRVQNLIAQEGFYLRLTVEGLGAIISPTGTM